MGDLDRLTCTQCGQSIEEHEDPTRTWYPQRIIDYAAMELAAANAFYTALHEERPFHDGSFTRWAQKRDRTHPYHFNDGVSIFLAAEDLHPDDDFLTDEHAVPSVANSADFGHGGPELTAES